ncbi:MAG TPA: Rieske 2Fe-2S domain-containing protein [Mycobacterium sp.]|nr:Rieske 2Fe-2S domain-containing protein [Mycobacterium sp.]
MTDIPMGAWTAALILDGADLLSPRSRGLAQAADIAVGVGIVGGFGAAVTGATDWQYTHDTARHVGLTHGVLNASALGLYLVSCRDRRRGRSARGRGIGLLGLLLASSAGLLGGDLVFRHRVGVDRSETSLEPREFVPVMMAAELASDEPRRVNHENVTVVLVRRGPQVYAVGELCSHLAAPMSEGWLYRGDLVCPWHGSCFDLESGAPVNGPATAPLACYQTRIRGGHIEIRRQPYVESDSDESKYATAVVSR